MIQATDPCVRIENKYDQRLRRHAKDVELFKRTLVGRNSPDEPLESRKALRQ